MGPSSRKRSKVPVSSSEGSESPPRASETARASLFFSQPISKHFFEEKPCSGGVFEARGNRKEFEAQTAQNPSFVLDNFGHPVRMLWNRLENSRLCPSKSSQTIREQEKRGFSSLDSLLLSNRKKLILGLGPPLWKFSLPEEARSCNRAFVISGRLEAF